MSGLRQQRIAEAYQKEISNILVYDVRDSRLDGVCVTKVVFTPDLRLAKIYYDVPGERERKAEVEKGFIKSKGYIKRELAQRVSVKYMPDIKFYFDETAALQESVDGLFEQIRKEKNAKAHTD